jgi:hypothetical protein
MNNSDLAYLFLLTVAISFSYFPIRWLLHYFFDFKQPALGNRWIISCLEIAIFSLFVYFVSYSISNEDLGNRIIHAFGGGFLAYMVSFLAAKDSGLILPKAKFFIFTFMLVMTLGIGNEVVEFFLQNNFGFTAAPTINDTWLDLMSNITGTLIAAVCFTPFLKSSRRSK